MANIGKRELNNLISDLKEIRRIATMETANFDIHNPETTIFVKQITELYRRTWIISPLDTIIEQLEGKRNDE